jgi:hypothetical protein
MKTIWMWAICLLTLTSLSVNAQPNPNCSDPGCTTTTIDVSTGYNHAASAFYPATEPSSAQDAYWQLVGAPAFPPITLGPAHVIQNVWSTPGSAEFLSAGNSYSFQWNNAPGTPAYTFERCFCLCEDENMEFTFTAYADDQVADILLDGVSIMTSPIPYTSNSNDHVVNGVPVNQIVPVPQGNHCLQVEVRNRFGIFMGFMLDGTITSPDGHLLQENCCNDTGDICGSKFNDQNQNGIWDSWEPGLAGWTIQLNPPSGPTTLTDTLGNYCFTDLPPGTYTLAEINQPGWTQTAPAGGTYTINLAANQAVPDADFGNFDEGTPPPCTGEPFFKWNPNGNCGIDFQDFSTVPNGLNIVCWDWDFGDGTTGSGPNPTHFYSAPGVYNVCMTILIVDGEDCCISLTYCEDVVVDECEPKDCYIEPKYTWKNSDCYYEFYGTAFTNANIDVWFWDFDDGTTAFGQNASHVFNPGSYNVCLTVISKPESEKDPCCQETYCEKIEVKECCIKPIDPMDSDKIGMGELEDQLDLNIPTSLQVYPNPTSGELVLKTDLKVESLNLRIFDTTGKLYFEGPMNSNEKTLQLEALGVPAGMLIIELAGEQQRLQKKVIYQK